MSIDLRVSTFCSLDLPDWSTTWAAIGALATVAAVVGIYLTARQLRFDAWLKAQEIWTDDIFIAARGRVFRHLDHPQITWNSDEKDQALLACRRAEEFCHLAPYFALTPARGRRKILQLWADPLAKLWAILEPLVKEERDRASWPEKWSTFETLGKSALAAIPETQRRRVETAVAAGSQYRPDSPMPPTSSVQTAEE